MDRRVSQLQFPTMQSRIGTPADVQPTSRDAQPAQSKKETDQLRILGYVRSCEPFGATDEEIQIALRMAGDTERPRRGELLKAGLIRDFGRRETKSGKLAKVWRLVQ